MEIIRKSPQIDVSKLGPGDIIHVFQNDLYYLLAYKRAVAGSDKYFLFAMPGFSLVDSGYSIRKMLEKADLLNSKTEVIPNDKIKFILQAGGEHSCSLD